MVKIWPSRAPGKGFYSGAKIFGSALQQSKRNVCVSSKRFLLTIEETLGKSYPVLWGMIQSSPNLSGMIWYINRSTKTKWSGLPTKSSYSVCTMSFCLAVVTVTKHQHDITFELFINTTIIKTTQLLINMITNIKQCIEMSCASVCWYAVALMRTLYSQLAEA